MPDRKKAKLASKCLELAILFEVTSNKPGNVNPVVGFKGTRVEHFLASAVASSGTFEKAASRGVAVFEGKLKLNEVGVGKLIKQCVVEVGAWQKGGNTLLGTVMLFVPIAVAAGMTPMGETGGFDLWKLRRNMTAVVKATTAKDAVYLYEAIATANPSGLNRAPDFDVNDAQSRARLIKENVTLYRVFEIAAGYDDISYEWVHGFPIMFDFAYPCLLEQLKTKNLNDAIVTVFLKILSERPDTFISRKVGLARAKKVSKEAAKILQLGGTETSEGRDSILRFDGKLREYGNNFNPGTTADITAATLALCTLGGYRP